MEGLEPGEARFDSSLAAWILSRYADVSAALREPRLSASPGSGAPGRDQAANAVVREAAMQTLASQRLAAWKKEIEPLAYQIAGALPAGTAVDLLGEFSSPWSLALASLASGASPSEAPRLARLAHDVFLAAADGSAPAQAAVMELAKALAGRRGGLDVQSFVALSQTLPYFLAAAWLALFSDDEQTRYLRAQPNAMPAAIEELLRFASPSRTVTRYAVEPLDIGGVSIARGDRVLLLLAAANRDPAQFPHPDRLQLSREASGHLAFGAGPHTCAGSALIRMAAEIATTALLETTTSVDLRLPVQWIGGLAIRAPGSLLVVLRRGVC
ncbi:MAG: cytochrome P450 [Bryobacterales bacterium]|nr:cytochrome P450 [Bryobacterales bacterium]